MVTAKVARDDFLRAMARKRAKPKDVLKYLPREARRIGSYPKR